MKFTVIWTPTAEKDLAAAWVDRAQDRAAITRAASSIDTLLRHDPQLQGESRYDTVRILPIPPLGVDFDVNEQDRLVYVLTVWYTGNSPRT